MGRSLFLRRLQIHFEMGQPGLQGRHGVASLGDRALGAFARGSLLFEFLAHAFNKRLVVLQGRIGLPGVLTAEGYVDDGYFPVPDVAVALRRRPGPSLGTALMRRSVADRRGSTATHKFKRLSKLRFL